MRGLKFLHFADMHLDMPFSSIRSADKPVIRRTGLKAAFKRIMDIALAENVDIVLIPGDLFEHGYVLKSTVSFINDCFKKLAGMRVVILPGNHDPISENSYYRSFNWSDNVFVLIGNQSQICFEDLNLTVFGSVKEVKHLEDSRYNILLYHGTVDLQVGNNNYNVTDSDFLSSLGMDYIALGHFHNRIDKLGGKDNIYNPGSPEPLGFDEEGEHGVILGELNTDSESGKILKIRYIPTGKYHYKTLEVDVSGMVSAESAADLIGLSLEKLGEQTAEGLYRIILKGYRDRSSGFDINEICTMLEGRAFYIDVVDRTVPDYDFESLSAENSLTGVFTGKMLELIENESDEREKDVLRKALYMGVGALSGDDRY